MENVKNFTLQQQQRWLCKGIEEHLIENQIFCRDIVAIYHQQYLKYESGMAFAYHALSLPCKTMPAID